MRVRLIKKLAQMIDGVDLRDRSVGDVFSLKTRDGKLLIAEQWAVSGAARRQVFPSRQPFSPAHAEDGPAHRISPRRSRRRRSRAQ